MAQVPQKMSSLAFTAGPSGLASNAPQDAYAFRNRFDIKSNSRLNFDDVVHVVQSGENDRIVITAGTLGSKIKDCRSLILWGSPYPDSATAASAGRKWRQIIISVLARKAIGCDFGDDEPDNLTPVEVAELHIRGLINKSSADRVFWDRVGLLVFRMNPDPDFIRFAGEAYGMSGLDDWPTLIASAEERYNGYWTNELRLAYELVHAALADTNPESRCILTVTGIETLIPYREKQPDLSRLLDELISVVSDMTDYAEDTRDAVMSALEYDKVESIGKYGRVLAGRLAGTYAGAKPKKFFADQYGLRSSLAHGNLRDKPKLRKDALNEQFLELLRFVLDILESWTVQPTFDEAATTAPDA